MNKLLIIFLLLFSFVCSGQEINDSYNFLGLIKLSDTDFISYRLDFEVVGDKVYGFSVSDILGGDETKSVVEGYVDRENSVIKIKETQLIYTKSKFDADIFCNLEFEFDLKKKLKKLEVPFKGYYSVDNSYCIEGDLILSSIGQFEKLYQKITEKSKKLERKGRINPEDMDILSEKINSITKNNITLKAKENLSLIWVHNSAELRFWDDAKFDKDKIEIKLNSKVIFNGIVEKDYKSLIIPIIKGSNTLIIKAINEGEVGRNTVAFELLSKKRNMLISNDLKTNETSRISLFKK